MTDTELAKAILGVSVETGSLVCLGCGHEHNCGIHGCAILREVAERYTALQKRHDELNNFEQSQCAKLLAQLAEKEKWIEGLTELKDTAVAFHANAVIQLTESERQRAAAVEALHIAISNHSTDERQTERLMRHYLAEASGPQEAGEVEHAD